MLKFIPIILFFLGLFFIANQKTCKSPFTHPAGTSICHPTPRWQVLLSESLWHTKCTPIYLTCSTEAITECANDWLCSYACQPDIICQK